MGSQLIDAVSAAYPSMAHLYSAQWAARAPSNGGYYVGFGGQLTPSGTSGKVDMAAAIDLFGPVEVNVAQVTAAATTIASLAPSAGNEVFVLCEVDSSGTLQFNAGSAAPFNSAVPPQPTAGRVVHAALYIRAGQTQVDANLGSPNGFAKLIDLRELIPGPSATGWQYDQTPWTFVSATTGAGGGVNTFKKVGVDATGYLTPGTKVSWNDGTNTPGYGVVASSSFSTDTTVTLIAQSDFTMANAALSAVRYSRSAAPVGFPTWFNWLPTVTGFSSPPSVQIYQWSAQGREITIAPHQGGTSTSNATSHAITLPVTAATVTGMIWGAAGQMTDNGAVVPGALSVASGASGCVMGPVSSATLANTASGSNFGPKSFVTYRF